MSRSSTRRPAVGSIGSTKLFSSFAGDVEWLPDGGTVVASGDDDVAAMYDVDRDIVRAGSMPATDTLVNGYAYLMPGPTDEVIVLDGQHPGHRYPLDPSRWWPGPARSRAAT